MGWCGIRGATSVERNEEVAILEATRRLLDDMRTENDIPVERIISVIFTVTPDLNAVYPARAAREIGWARTPLLCTSDMDVPGSLPKCIRVLMHAQVDRSDDEVRHVYHGKAVALRPDWHSKETP